MINNILDSISNLIYEFGYLGIFIAALVETLFPIIPSELIFPLAGYVAQSQNLGIISAITFGLIGSIGSTVGALIIYTAALKVGRKVLLKIGRYFLINEKKLEKSELWFKNHGKLAVFLGRLAPGVRELISIPAGLSRMNIIEFTFFTFIGSFIWSLSLTLVGYYLGEAWNKFSKESSPIFNILAVIIIFILSGIIVYRYFRKRKNKGGKIGDPTDYSTK
ncbi:MAG TPA: DedA family protein [Nitrososphaeraceae archaeon]|nr:DedA family protein [Nitrososphaeraceae archaeon]